MKKEDNAPTGKQTRRLVPNEGLGSCRWEEAIPDGVGRLYQEDIGALVTYWGQNTLVSSRASTWGSVRGCVAKDNQHKKPSPPVRT